jgi:hypothetical protein
MAVNSKSPDLNPRHSEQKIRFDPLLVHYFLPDLKDCRANHETNVARLPGSN